VARSSTPTALLVAPGGRQGLVTGERRAMVRGADNRSRGGGAGACGYLIQFLTVQSCFRVHRQPL